MFYLKQAEYFEPKKYFQTTKYYGKFEMCFNNHLFIVDSCRYGDGWDTPSTTTFGSALLQE